VFVFIVNGDSFKESTGCDRIGLTMTSQLWRHFSQFF